MAEQVFFVAFGYSEPGQLGSGVPIINVERFPLIFFLGLLRCYPKPGFREMADPIFCFPVSTIHPPPWGKLAQGIFGPQGAWERTIGILYAMRPETQRILFNKVIKDIVRFFCIHHYPYGVLLLFLYLYSTFFGLNQSIIL